MMMHTLKMVLHPERGEDWPETVDRVRSALGAPHNRSLFPPHFLKSTFPSISGRLLEIRHRDAVAAAAFFFPRDTIGGGRVWTVRFHRAPGFASLTADDVQQCAAEVLGDEGLVMYDPDAPHTFTRTGRPVGAIEIGHPDAGEATVIPELQREIWGSESDYLYPADIHADAFRLGTSLVARDADAAVGFLFGFAKFGGSTLPDGWVERFRTDLRLESQMVGVLPSHRRHGMAYLLKREQAEQARAAGIDLVNWTVDPLQYRNALLNFGRLRAVAFDFFPDYYAFRNRLNQVASSRFGITWLVGSPVVRRALASERPTVDVAHVGEAGDIQRVNDGYEHVRFDADGATIAIEIPIDWTGLQETDLDAALRWRAATDQIFAHYVGPAIGRYAVTGVGEGPGDRVYLIAERVDAAFLARYTAINEEESARAD